MLDGDSPATATGPVEQSSPTGKSEFGSPTDSLRAAALLTLKFKRRKPGIDQPATNRPQSSADVSMQLDYGQEDVVSASPNTLLEPAHKQPETAADLEDIITREEGEISDSEEANKRSPLRLGQHELSSSTVVPPRARSTSRSFKQESPPQSAIEMVLDPPEILNPISYFIDAEHVRPGLTMNQTQYDAAKDIVLDILGWGVPPTYLLECGLSREIIFYVFTELNLRLPENLDTHDLIPYRHILASSIPLDDTSLSVPQILLPDTTPTTPSSVHVANSISVSPATPSPSNLHDMERQRRQELLARKAVQASRKTKAAPLSSSEDSPDHDIDAHTVPSETVDDFLKSIGSHTTMGISSVDAMDVDEGPNEQDPRKESSPTPSERHAEDSVPFVDIEMEPPSTRSGSEEAAPPSLQRRSKRPVAADFVDSELRSPKSNGVANGRGAMRRQAGSFATVSTMRRCVIDLSDSENDGDDLLVTDLRTADPELSSANGLFARDPSLLPSRTLSPATLVEKELEIRKMRELIAKREQDSRAKKLTRLNTSFHSESLVSDVDATAELVPEVESPITTMDVEPAELIVAGNGTHSAKSSRSNSPLILGEQPSATAITIEVLPQAGDEDHETQEEQEQEPAAHPQSSPKARARVLTRAMSASMHSSPSKTFVDEDQEDSEPVDVDPPPSTSAQRHTNRNHRKHEENQHVKKHELFPIYVSAFEHYPFLRSQARRSNPSFPSSLDTPSSLTISTDASSISSYIQLPPLDPSPSSLSPHSPQVIDLKPLKLAAAILHLDPAKAICQYEVPGGGVCRDSKCRDNHINRNDPSSVSGQDPSDEETAQYLSTALPENWLSLVDHRLTEPAVKILAAMKQARLDQPSVKFEERVAWALCTLAQSLRESTQT